MTAVLLALLAALPAAAASGSDAERVDVAVHRGLELVAVVDALAGAGNFRLDDSAYAAAVESSFRPHAGHPAVKAYAEAAARGLDTLRLQHAMLAPESTGPLSRAEESLSAKLERFAADAGFDEFFAAQQPRFELWKAGVRAQARETDYVAYLEDYAGMVVSAGFTLYLTPLRDAAAGTVNIAGADAGRPRVHSSLAPAALEGGEPVFDFAHLRWTLWHELGHTLLNEPFAALPAADGRLARYFAPRCYEDWRGCAREHVVQGVAFRMLDWARRTGRERAPITVSREPVLTRLSVVEESLRRREAIPAAKRPSLEKWLPRVMDAFAAKAKRQSAR
jgi:hypothetical protein